MTTAASVAGKIGPTHEEWQGQVTELAAALGWRWLHVRRSIGKGRKWVTTTNRTGWPDLFLWHPRMGFAAIELKVGKDVASPEQLAVLAELEVAGAATMVAWPADLDTLVAMLTPVTMGDTSRPTTRRQ